MITTHLDVLQCGIITKLFHVVSNLRASKRQASKKFPSKFGSFPSCSFHSKLLVLRTLAPSQEWILYWANKGLADIKTTNIVRIIIMGHITCIFTPRNM